MRAENLHRILPPLQKKYASCVSPDYFIFSIITRTEPKNIFLDVLIKVLYLPRLSRFNVKQ
ncbi:MAG: hypothetical protein QNJ51_10105 [Calothrix sp. MO_167.B12]|nr:hypothetical protein [Calothrix sp. MO_167.B12]